MTDMRLAGDEATTGDGETLHYDVITETGILPLGRHRGQRRTHNVDRRVAGVAMCRGRDSANDNVQE